MDGVQKKISEIVNGALEMADRAPSGDNSQPWQSRVGYSVDGQTISLFVGLSEAASKKKMSSDYRNILATLSLGAFACNFTQALKAASYKIVRITQEGAEYRVDFAYTKGFCVDFDRDVILKRRTDRSLWERKDLNPQDRDALLGRIVGSDFSAKEITAKNNFRSLMSLLAAEVVRYLNDRSRKDFFDCLRFGSEAQKTKDGLEDWALGIDWAAIQLMKALRNIKWLRAIACPILAIPMSLVGCWSRCFFSSSIIFLTRNGDQDLDWFHLGMKFQEMWLAATEKGLAVQPVGVTFLLYQNEVIPPMAKAFTLLQSRMLTWATGNLSEKWGIDFSKAQICFRVGYSRVKSNPRMTIRRPSFAQIFQISKIDLNYTNYNFKEVK